MTVRLTLAERAERYNDTFPKYPQVYVAGRKHKWLIGAARRARRPA